MFWEDKKNKKISILKDILNGKVLIKDIKKFKAESNSGTGTRMAPDVYRLINDIERKYYNIITIKNVGVWENGLLAKVGIEIVNGKCTVYQKFSG